MRPVQIPVLCMLFFCGAIALAEESVGTPMVAKLFNGLEYKGVLQNATAAALVLKTSRGVVTLRRTDVVSTRTVLTEAERKEIAQAEAAPSAPKAAEAQPATEKTPAQTPDAQTVARAIPANAPQDPYERMHRQLSRHVTLEFAGTPLVDALSFLSQLTGANIVLDPKVRTANPPVSLKVQDMEAATVIRWLMQLSGNFADVRNQAIWITDKEPKELENEERQHIMELAAAMKANVDLPPEGTPLTDLDRTKIALQLWEKEQPKPADFPGPNISTGAAADPKNVSNPFAVGQ